jgi:hypothetical protein
MSSDQNFTTSSDEARRAGRRFAQEERARDGRAAMTEYEAQAVAVRAKTVRLKALRLANEAKAQTERPPAKPAKRRSRATRKIPAL